MAVTAFVKKLIQKSLEKDRLSNVYLLSGTAGSDIAEVVNYLICSIACLGDNKPCFECSGCKKALNKEGILVIDAKKTDVKEIKELLDIFLKASLVYDYRIFIIERVEYLSGATANRLLKFLEEIGQTDFGIMTTENISSVLPTIVSRASVITVPTLFLEDKIAYLSNYCADEKVVYVLSMSAINVHDAKLLVTEESFISFIQATELIYSNTIDVQKNIINLYRLNEALFTGKEDLFIDLLIALALIEIRTLSGESQYFDDVLSAKISAIENINKVIKKLQLFNEIKNKMQSNANKELLVLEVLLKLKGELQ